MGDVGRCSCSGGCFVRDKINGAGIGFGPYLALVIALSLSLEVVYSNSLILELGTT